MSCWLSINMGKRDGRFCLMLYNRWMIVMLQVNRYRSVKMNTVSLFKTRKTHIFLSTVRVSAKFEQLGRATD